MRSCLWLEAQEGLIPLNMLGALLLAHTLNVQHTACASLMHKGAKGSDAHLLRSGLVTTCAFSVGGDSSVFSYFQSVFHFPAASLVHKLENCPGWICTLG